MHCSGFRLQASGIGLFLIRADVKAFNSSHWSINKCSPNSTSWHDQDQNLSTVLTLTLTLTLTTTHFCCAACMIATVKDSQLSLSHKNWDLQGTTVCPTLSSPRHLALFTLALAKVLNHRVRPVSVDTAINVGYLTEGLRNKH